MPIIETNQLSSTGCLMSNLEFIYDWFEFQIYSLKIILERTIIMLWS